MLKFSTIKYHIKNTENLSAVIVLVIAAAILVFYGIFKFIDYSKKIKVELKNKAEYTSDLSSLILKEPVWNYDMATVKSIVTALADDSEIQLIELINIDNSVMFQTESEKDIGKDAKQKLIIVEKEIRKNDIDEVGTSISNQYLGKVKLGFTGYYKEKTLIKEFISSFVWILVSSIFAFYSISAFLKQEKKSKDRIASILDNMADSVITVDENLIIKSSNLATEKLFGFKTNTLIGSKLTSLLKFDPNSIVINNNFTIDDCKHYVNNEIIGIRSNHTEIPIEFNISAINMNNEATYIFVIRDITQRNEINKIKSEFVSIVSHELRTPLTSIMGALDLIIADVIPDKESKQQMLSLARNNSSTLLTLINNILDIEKLTQDQMKFSIEPLNINEVINEVINANHTLLEKQKFTVNFEPFDKDVKVLADKDKLIQVIANLLSNAVKFSDDDCLINIRVSEIENAIRTSIQDFGCGIDEKDKERLFDKFVQADSSTTRKKGGSGLGLTICKGIITKMNGNIGFDSELGKGSTFYFDLPLAE